jgi:hypothetical protein
MMLIHPPAEDDLEQQLPAMIGPGGYANPEVPIRVALARDAEAAGIESEATKIPPPAYGLWRESVVRKFLSRFKTLKLIIYSEWIPTAYSGNGMRQQHWNVRTLSPELKAVILQPTDLHPISRKKVWIM